VFVRNIARKALKKLASVVSVIEKNLPDDHGLDKTPRFYYTVMAPGTMQCPKR